LINFWVFSWEDLLQVIEVHFQDKNQFDSHQFGFGMFLKSYSSSDKRIFFDWADAASEIAIAQKEKSDFYRALFYNCEKLAKIMKKPAVHVSLDNFVIDYGERGQCFGCKRFVKNFKFNFLLQKNN
jgi:hypothetical protein